jgi:hypothetical protein
MEEIERDLNDSITDGLKTVSYSVNNGGIFELVTGDGWQPVNDVNRQAWREIEKKVDLARRKVAAGRFSCLYYHMVANQMNVFLLARYTGQRPWTVFCHLLPFFFQRLQVEQVQKYADLFHISPAELAKAACNR